MAQPFAFQQSPVFFRASFTFAQRPPVLGGQSATMPPSDATIGMFSRTVYVTRVDAPIASTNVCVSGPARQPPSPSGPPSPSPRASAFSDRTSATSPPSDGRPPPPSAPLLPALPARPALPSVAALPPFPAVVPSEFSPHPSQMTAATHANVRALRFM